MSFKISESYGLAVAGGILTIILVVLDKAGKLKGWNLYALLAVAAALTLPLALGNSWVTDVSGVVRGVRSLAAVCVVGLAYALLANWIATGEGAEILSRTPAIKPELAGIVVQARMDAMMNALPIVVSPHSSAFIIRFRPTETAEGLDYRNNTDKSYEWPVIEDRRPKKAKEKKAPKLFPYEKFAVFMLTNHGDKDLYNVKVIIPTKFQVSENGQPVSEKPGTVVVGFDVVSAGKAAQVYLVNQSTKHSVILEYPGEAEAEVQGQRGRYRFPVQTRNMGLGGIDAILDQVPAVLFESSHEWTGDTIPKPFIEPKQ